MEANEDAERKRALPKLKFTKVHGVPVPNIDKSLHASRIWPRELLDMRSLQSSRRFGLRRFETLEISTWQRGTSTQDIFFFFFLAFGFFCCTTKPQNLTAKKTSHATLLLLNVVTCLGAECRCVLGRVAHRGPWASHAASAHQQLGGVWFPARRVRVPDVPRRSNLRVERTWCFEMPLHSRHWFALLQYHIVQGRADHRNKNTPQITTLKMRRKHGFGFNIKNTLSKNGCCN
jgi:hypothetical protein